MMKKEAKAKILTFVAGALAATITATGTYYKEREEVSQFRSRLSSNALGSDLQLEISLGGQDKVLLKLIVSSRLESPSFVATLDDKTPLNVRTVQQATPSLWELWIYEHGGTSPYSKFLWPSGVPMVIRDGSSYAPELRHWQLHTATKGDDSSKLEAGRDAHELKLLVMQLAGLVAGLIVLGVAVFKSEHASHLPSLSAQLIQAACKPGPNDDPETYGLGEVLLRGVLFEEKGESELLTEVGAKVEKASAGYRMVRMRLAVEIRKARLELDALSRQLPTKGASDAN